MADTDTLPPDALGANTDLDRTVRGKSPTFDSEIAAAQGAYKGAAKDAEGLAAGENKALAETSNYHDELEELKKSAPKLDTKPFTPPEQKDPITAFGSAAGLFGIIASALTKTPLVTALTASTSAINALKAKNEDEYQKSFKVWKENTDYALKAAEFEGQNYDRILNTLDKDFSGSLARARAFASAIGDTTTLHLLEAGNPEQIVSLLQSRASAAASMASTAVELDKLHQNRDLYKQGLQELGPNPTLDQKINLRNKVFGTGGFANAQKQQQAQEATSDLLNQIDNVIPMLKEGGASGLGVTGITGLASRAVEFGEGILGKSGDTTASSVDQQISDIAQKAQRILAGGRYSTKAAEDMAKNIGGIGALKSPQQVAARLKQLRDDLSKGPISETGGNTQASGSIQKGTKATNGKETLEWDGEKWTPVK